MNKKLEVTLGGAAAADSIRTTIGIDLGDRWSRYCMVDCNGEIVEEGRVQTTAEALEQRFGKMPATRMVIEAGTHSPWISRQLEKMGHHVIVANARKVAPDL